MAGLAQLEAISAQLRRARVQIVREPSARRRLGEDPEHLHDQHELPYAYPHARREGAVKPQGSLAQLAEKRAGRIEQLAALIERALQLLRQRNQLGQLLCPLEMERRAVRLRETEPPRRIARADEARDLHQL